MFDRLADARAARAHPRARGIRTTVLPRSGARTGCRRPSSPPLELDPGALEVRGVGGNVRLRLEAVATTAARVVRARAEELDAVGDDLDGLALGAVLGLPFAPVEPPLDGDGASLGEVVGAVLALRAPDGDVEVVGLVDPLAALPSLRRLLTATRSLQTEVPPGVERSSGSLVKFPVIAQILMLRSCHLIAPLFLSIPNVDTKQPDGVFSPPSGKKDRKLREGMPSYSSRSSRRPRRPSRSAVRSPTEAGRSEAGRRHSPASPDRP